MASWGRVMEPNRENGGMAAWKAHVLLVAASQLGTSTLVR